MTPFRTKHRLSSLIVVVFGAALLLSCPAYAGYAVGPNGETIAVSADSSGNTQTPTSVDLVVYLDAEDSSPVVWISDTPTVGSFGRPSGRTLGTCTSGSLLPFGEQNKWVCRTPTRQMQAGQTYYWWLAFRRQDLGATSPTDRVSGPFSFSLVQQLTPASTPTPTPTPPPPVEEPPDDPHAPISTKTITAAATLPSSNLFDGRRSIKHTTLTTLVYRTMKQLGVPRQLAFACWNQSDWLSVLAAEGTEPETGNTRLLGFWLGRQPRWLHLAPGICTDLQGLLSSKRPNGRRAGALTTLIHETLHAHGVSNEAQTNCFAVQLVPFFGSNLGLRPAQATYLGTLARNYIRNHAPSGYWNSARCRDGGTWDLLPRTRNLG